jgi:hypothetical protein
MISAAEAMLPQLRRQRVEKAELRQTAESASGAPIESLGSINVKLVLHCPECGIEAGQFVTDLIPQNHSRYSISCPHGHAFPVEILNLHFEKLFETSIYSIVNGYYREAVGAFAASHEAFMRLFIEIVVSARETDKSSSQEAWKKIEKQSERQLGAYIYLYLTEFNSMPLLIPEKKIGLRNRVIHQGYFPGKEECLAYGRCILASIRDAKSKLHESEALTIEISKSIFKTGELFPGGGGMSYLVWPLIGLNRPPGVDEKTLDEMVEYIAGLGSLPWPSVGS